MPGNAAGIDILIGKVRAAASTRDRLVKVLAEEAITQTRLGFRESRDPYGNTWAPLKLRSGKPLDDTGAHLKNRITVLASSADSFRIGTNFVGARVHQHGAVIEPKRAKALRFSGYTRSGRRGGSKPIFAKRAVIPKRAYLPDERGIGPIWAPALKAAATRFLSRLFQG